MKPEPRVRVTVQCMSKSKVQKGKDGKSNPSSTRPACKNGEGDPSPGPSTGRKLRSNSKKTEQLECPQCFKLFEHGISMKHLLEHERERRAKFYSPTSDIDAAIQEAKQKCRQVEIERRRFLYQNLGDPRRYRDDAILVCPGCQDNKLYFTMDDFCQHCFSCSKYKQLKERFGLKI